MPLPRDAVVALDAELARIARTAGAQRLCIGEALEEMNRRQWHHELGFPNLTAYVLERCSQSGCWGIDTCALARKLANLPVLRAALVKNTLGWAMVDLLARHATAENEAGLVVQASGSTVRRMRALLRAAAEARRAGTDSSTDSDTDRATISVTLSADDAWLLEHVRWLFDRVQPKVNTDQFVHWLVVEGLTSLAELVPRGEMAEFHARADELRERSAAWRAELRAWCDEAEARGEDRLDLAVADANDSSSEPEPDSSDWDPSFGSYPTACSLDAHIRALCQELATRDLLFGALAERFWKSDGWRRLGYASERQYARERLGVSLSAIKTKRALARQSERMPSVAAAIERRTIGFEAAMLVTRVATEQTVDAWIARASERTIKLLRQEVAAVELRIRFGAPRDQPPPDLAALRDIAEQRQAASERLTRADAEGGAGKAFADRARTVLSQMSGEPGGRAVPKRELGAPSERGFGRVSYRFQVTKDTRELWCAFEECFCAARAWLPPGVSPMRLLAIAFFIEWSHVLDNEVAYGHIYARDGFECQSPLCTRRDVTPHHLTFRSQGGGDEAENLIALCVWCHLFGVHAGLIRALGTASNIRWELGREPILIVEGRTKIEASDIAPAA